MKLVSVYLRSQSNNGGSWVNLHQPMTHVTHPESDPFDPLVHDPSTHCLLWTRPDPTCVFTALHEMQTRSSDENSVRLSVRLFVCLSDA